MPLSTQTYAPTTGNDGRVIIGSFSGGVIIAGIAEWKWSKKTGPVPVPHFEMGANADGVLFPDKLRGMGDGGVVHLNGRRNFSPDDTETVTGLRNGVFVSLILVTSKTAGTGYEGVAGLVTNFETGAKVGNEAEDFSCDVEVSGVPPEHGVL